MEIKNQLYSKFEFLKSSTEKKALLALDIGFFQSERKKETTTVDSGKF